MRPADLSRERLSRWCTEVTAEAERVTGSFEAVFGYPPGANTVRRADDADTAAMLELATVPVAAPDLIAFYSYVGEIVLGDMGNGYFVHPARLTVTHYREEGAVSLPAPEDPRGLVFASDGGGILFAVGAEGTVYRSRAASFSADFEKIAENLGEFLEMIHLAVVRFAATGGPGAI